MGTEDARLEVRSVMFLAGEFEALNSGDGYAQLDGVLELLNFANSYVLSDHTAIGGALTQRRGVISEFLGRHAQESDDIEVIGHGSQYSWDLLPFEDRSKMDALEGRLEELDRLN